MKGLRNILIFFAVCAAFIALGVGGISADYSEVADLELVRTIAVDKEGDNVVLTVSSGTGAEGDKAKITGTEAGSLATAINELRRGAFAREPFFSHVEHIIIGESAARDTEGIKPYLDYISRSTDMRMDTNIFIVKGQTARSFLIETTGENTTAADMLSFLEKDVDKTTSGHVFTCGQVSAALAEGGVALIQAVTLNGETSLEDQAQMVIPDGFAIIKDGVLTDFTSLSQTKGICIVKETAKFETVDMKIAGGSVSLGVTGVKTDIDAEFSEGGLSSVNITVDIDANVEQMSGVGEITEASFRKELCDMLSETEKRRITLALQGSVASDADFMDIGQSIKLKHPYKYGDLKNSFIEELKNAQVNIQVNVTIQRSYDILDPNDVDGE